MLVVVLVEVVGVVVSVKYEERINGLNGHTSTQEVAKNKKTLKDQFLI